MNPPAPNRLDPPPPPPTPPPPRGWAAALLDLISARSALIEFEAAQASRRTARAAILLASAAMACAFGWLLLVAAGVFLLASATGWHPALVTLLAGFLHFAAAIALASAAKSAKLPAFPLTRAEFQKDREWLLSLQSPPKSND
jgi:uncharacterized membrane protein YqjE